MDKGPLRLQYNGTDATKFLSSFNEIHVYGIRRRKK